MMVTKQCPKCHENIPVACKTCPCGHQFAKSHRDGRHLQPHTPSRRTDRPRRLQSTSNLYLEAVSFGLYARRKPVVKNGTNKTEETTGRRKGFFKVSKVTGKNKRPAEQREKRQQATGGTEGVKRKRGRPKGSTSTPKGGAGRGARLLNRSSVRPKPGADQRSAESKEPPTGGAKEKEVKEVEEDSDMYDSLPPDKVAQYSVVLQEINRKFFRAGNFRL